MDSPVYHPQWLIELWVTTPILNKLNPHLVTLLLLVGITLFFYFKMRDRNQEPIDHVEEEFQHLLRKKQYLEEELKNIQESPDDGSLKIVELERKIQEINKELQQFV